MADGETATAQQSTSISFFSDSFVLRRGKQPLISMEFVLDLGDEGNRLTLEKEIKSLGGTVSQSLNEDAPKPFCLITDHPHADYLERVTKPGKVIEEVGKAFPVMLRDAVKNGIRVRSYESFRLILSNLQARLKLIHRAKMAPVRPSIPDQEGIRILRAPYMKLEDNAQLYAPTFSEYDTPTNFRPVYLGEKVGKSIFHMASPASLKRKYETKTAKPRAKSRVGPGFCDICERKCPDMQLHFACKEHQKRISTPGLYDEVDALCGSFVKEIVMPNKRLRKRPIPEPLPLPPNQLAELHISRFWPASDSAED